MALRRWACAAPRRWASSAASAPTLRAEQHARHTAVEWPDGHRQRFHHVWLRTNCTCAACCEPSSKQRLAAFPRDARALAVRQVRADNAALLVDWADGHQSRFADAFLRAHAYDDELAPRGAQRPAVAPWTRASFAAGGVPALDYAAVVRDGARGSWRVLQQLQRTGVLVLDNAPRASGVVGPLAAQLAGYVQETLYGRTFDVKVVPNPHNAAYAPVPLPLHMDLCYYEAPPGFQFLHFIRTECRGGANALVDMRSVADRLRVQHPDAFDTLRRVRFTFHFRDGDNWMYYRRPMIVTDPDDGEVVQVFWSPPWQGPLHAPFSQVEAAYDAYAKLDDIVNNHADLQHVQRFEAGQILLFNNRRVAHSREEFVAADGVRHAEGTYISLDEFANRYRVLQERYGDVGEHNAYGINVDSALGNFSFK